MKEILDWYYFINSPSWNFILLQRAGRQVVYFRFVPVPFLATSFYQEAKLMFPDKWLFTLKECDINAIIYSRVTPDGWDGNCFDVFLIS